MIALIGLYHTELLKVNGFAPSTVDTYTISIKAFCSFAKRELKMEPVLSQDTFKLLDSFDQSSWHGLRNYTMVAVLWA